MFKNEKYWWDFRDELVIVQSTRQDCLTAFTCIEYAEDFIKRLEEGQVKLNSDGSLKHEFR
jgi:hypothetical protein